MKNITFLLPNMDVGGVQRVNSVVADSLNEDYNVNILLTQNKNIEFLTTVSCSVVERYTKIEDYILRAVKKMPRNLDVIEYQLDKVMVKKIVANLKNLGTDIVIVSADLILQVPLLKKMMPNITIISWVHNNIDIYINNYFKYKQKQLILGLEMSDSIVCLTGYDLEKISEMNNNTICIANPLTLENNTVSKLNKPYIVCVARYSINHKGLDYLIEIASKLPDPWIIKLVGSGNKKEQREIAKLITKWDAHKKIELCGNLNGLNLSKCYRESSIYLMTSRWEGFGLVLVEAMSFGLPIIAFSQTGSDEVLQHGKFGVIVEQGNINAMVEALLEIINSPEKIKVLSDLSIKRTESFNISTISNQWKLVINSI